MSINKKYLKYAETTIYSLVSNTKSKITLYLMNHSLDSKDINLLKSKFINKVDLIEIDVKNTSLDKLPVYMHMSIETYYRLLAQFLLPKEVERVLWLDADIVVLKDITEFYNQDFNDKSIIACYDRKYKSNRINEIKEQVGISKESPYFNAGVILFNLKKMQNLRSEDEIVEICYKLQPKVTLMDQDILNYIYQFDVKYDDYNKYNYQVSDDIITDLELSKIHILHYSSGKKPWIYLWLNKNSKYYWDLKLEQGYVFDFILIQIKNKTFNILRNIKRLFIR